MKMEEHEPDEDELGEVLLESEREALLREELAQVKAALELSQKTAAEDNRRRELQAADERAVAEFRGWQAAVRRGKGGDSGKGKRR